MKKFLPYVLVTVLSISIFTAVTYAHIEGNLETMSNIGRFKDVSSNDVEALYLSNVDIVLGYPDLTVRADKNVNRAEAAALFVRMFGIEPAEKMTCAFSDVSPKDWFYEPISTLCEAGLIKGYPDGTFKPGNTITRAETLAILVRGLVQFHREDVVMAPPWNTLPSDVGITQWYAPYAAYAAEKNLLDIEESHFNGGKNYTRGDVFVNMYRALRLKELGRDVYSHALDPVVVSAEKLETFGSDEDFDTYANYLSEITFQENEVFAESESFDEESIADIEVSDSPALDAISAPEPAAVSESKTEESITNVQEASVDEGGIVKTHGDHLVVLRRGRLFTVGLGETSALVDQETVYRSSLDSDAWYDEMLIAGDTIVVVGYSYNFESTEIALFKINGAGELSYNTTYFLDSNDYYSSRNYTSRLVGNELIFYMPHYLFTTVWDEETGDYREEASLPGLRQWNGSEVVPLPPILSKENIYRPVQDIAGNEDPYPTLHTVVKCDLTAETLDCGARAILGPYARNFYVSPEAVYVWVSNPLIYEIYEVGDASPSDENLDDVSTLELDTASIESMSVAGVTPTRAVEVGSRDRAFVYRMDIATDAVTAVSAYGQPIDQFSFKDDGTYLNVVVSDDSWGEGMWNPEFVQGDLLLGRIPLADFSSDLPVVSTERYRELIGIGGYNMVNRFVGEHVLYGESSNWWNEVEEHNVYVTNYTTDDPVHTVALSHSVNRLEVLGDSAVVVGQKENDLQFTSIDLLGAPEPKVIATHAVPNASEGELRSHGFFFKQYEDKDFGVLGLPVRTSGNFTDSFIQESSSVIFLKVDPTKTFSDLGQLASSNKSVDDNCQVSCVDWYGNSRPIFYRGRIFALLGYELVEGKLQETAIEEIHRIDFTPVTPASL